VVGGGGGGGGGGVWWGFGGWVGLFGWGFWGGFGLVWGGGCGGVVGGFFLFGRVGGGIVLGGWCFLFMFFLVWGGFLGVVLVGVGVGFLLGWSFVGGVLLVGCCLWGFFGRWGGWVSFCGWGGRGGGFLFDGFGWVPWNYFLLSPSFLSPGGLPVKVLREVVVEGGEKDQGRAEPEGKPKEGVIILVSLTLWSIVVGPKKTVTLSSAPLIDWPRNGRKKTQNRGLLSTSDARKRKWSDFESWALRT